MMITRLRRSRREKARHASHTTKRAIAARKSLNSLPENILRLVISYLAFLDRFRLKLAGSHSLAAVISSFPPPSFSEYLAQLEPLKSKGWKLRTGPEKILHIACEEGHAALAQKLLSEQPAIADLPGLQKCLIASIVCRQELIAKILLGHMKTLSKTIRKELEGALEYAATNNLAWVIPLFLRHGARPSSPRGIRGLQKAAESGHEEVVAILSRKIHWRRGRKLAGALIKAVQNGHEGTVKILLKRGATMPQNSSFPGAKHVAAEEGHESILKMLILKDPEDHFVKPPIFLGDKDTRITAREVYYTRPQKWCCLHFAVYGGHYDIVKYIMDKRIRPRGNTEDYGTVLPLAAKFGHTDMVELFLERRFNISAGLQGWTALTIAVRTNNLELVRILLDAGAEICDGHLRTAAVNGFATLMSILLERGADVHTKKNYDGETLLHLAASNDNRDVIEVLLMFGADIEAPTRYGHTPLDNAIQKGHEQCVKLLLDRGATTKHKTYELGTAPTSGALVCAIETGHSSLIPLIIQYGADVNERQGWGGTPLHRAAAHGSIMAIDTLIEAGARRNVRDSRKRTVLHYAAVEGRSEVIPRLLELGFDIEAKDEEGQTPLHLARYEGCDETYNVLVSHGADPEAKDHKGKTAAQVHKEKVEEWPKRGLYA